MMRNRPEFHWLDLAAQFLRATPVSASTTPRRPRRSSTSPATPRPRWRSSRTPVPGEFARGARPAPAARSIFVIDVRPAAAGRRSAGRRAARARRRRPRARSPQQTEPDDLATLIYTSGTTGPPKGVMISQYNVMYTVEQLRRCMELLDEEIVGQRIVSYLPMAHIAERMTSHYQAMRCSVTASTAAPTRRCSPSYLKEVRPEIVFGVPRVWEKIYIGVNAALAADPEKQAAVRRGRRRRDRDQGRPSGRHGHRGAARDVGVPRRRRLLDRARARRARRARGRRHRRGADPAEGAGVVHGHRCADARDLRDERVEPAR